MSLREEESRSIRRFVQLAADDGYLSGRVLDYGCGKQPYRDIVEAAGAQYDGFDLVRFGGNLSGANITPPWKEGYQAVLCNQVVQYVLNPPRFARALYVRLTAGGYLVMTYPTNWPEVESDDLHRFTKAGMERLLAEAGFEIVRHDWRHGFNYDGISFAAGYGVVARA
jgi:Methyltransferase domain